jgi:serine/threonine-protein kinase RsbT
MNIQRSETLPVRNQENVVLVRQLVRAWAIELGFSLVDQTKLVTAASELARNTIDHGGGGLMHIELVNNGFRQGLRLVFEDQGPGIVNLELAMQDGYSTRGGLGMGLSGSRRLVNEFQVESTPGIGTRITIIKWK